MNKTDDIEITPPKNKIINNSTSSLVSLITRDFIEGNFVNKTKKRKAEYYNYDHNKISINNKRKVLDESLGSHSSSSKTLAISKSKSVSSGNRTVFEQAMEFVRAGDQDSIREYLNSGVMSNINLVNQDNYTLLMQACKEGLIDSVLFLLDLGADINLKCKGDCAALNIACLYGHMDIVKLLLSRGALVNNCTAIGGSALMSACEGGHLDIVTYLLDLGADINAVGGKHGTALRAACHLSNVELINLLLAHGADINLADSSGNTALMEACRMDKGEIVAILLESKADVNVVDANGRNAVITTCIAAANAIDNKGYIDILRLLARQGALVDQADSKGDTALILMCRKGLIAIDIIMIMLELGADVNKADYRGRTPLMIACSSSSLPLIQTLLDAGAAVNAVDDLDNTALFLTTSIGVLNLLLSHGADVNIASKYRGSALLAASVMKRWDVVELLLEHGADLCGNGVSLVSRARKAGQAKIIEMLLDCEEVGPLFGTDIARLAEDQTTYPDLTELIAHITLAVEDGSKLTYRQVLARVKSGKIRSFRGASREAFSIAACFGYVYYNALLTACNTGRLDILELLLDCGEGFEGYNTLRSRLLVDACTSRTFDIAKLILSYGADVNVRDENGRTALVAACYTKDALVSHGYTPAYTIPAPAVELVKLLLAYGADPNKADKEYTPLAAAALTGDVEVLKLLLYEGADVKGPEALPGDSAALAACRSGSSEVVNLLQSYGADLLTEADECLVAACESGIMELVQWLLDHDADVNVVVKQEGKKVRPLSVACKQGHYDIAQLLLERGATIPVDLLPTLCEAGNLDILKLLVAYGADVNGVTSIDGESPLHIACLHTRPDVAKWLLESGADVTKVNKDGKTALDLIKDEPYSLANRAMVLEALLEHGAGLDIDTSAIFERASVAGCDGILNILLSHRPLGSDTKPLSTALYNACKQNRVERIQQLLQLGATVAEADEGQPTTCLAESSHYDNVETIKLLLDHGADVNGVGRSLTTPLMVASCYGCVKVIKLLLSRGANIDAADKDGNTALHLLCLCGRIETFKLLLVNGADVHLANLAESTPLTLAASGKKYNRIKPLLEAGADVTAVDGKGMTAMDYLRDHPASVQLCERYREKNMTSQKPILK